jgi:hypothetical protein
MKKSILGRAVAVLGLGLVLGATVALPADARQDPGPTPTVTLPYSQDVYERHYGTQVEPATPAYRPITRIVRVDDNEMEVLQLAAGVLAGIALAGTGAAVASRRTHAQAHPA